MIRVTRITTGNGGSSLQVEGRLTRQTVEELRMACDAVLTRSEPVRLDLSGLRFLDAAGLGLLRELEQRGVEVTGRRGFVDELMRSRSESPAPPDSHEPLVARLRAGEQAAFEQMVREHGGRMLATARRVVRVEEDARDVVQEAFIAAFRSIDRFAGAARLSTWLHRIVLNAALMKLRGRRRRREDSIEDLLPRFSGDGHFAEPQDRWETSAADLLEERETRTIVRSAIDRLPASYRTVLILRDIEERDTDDTAAALGVTPNAVKTRLHRARQALRTLLAQDLIATPRHAQRAEA